MPYFRSAVSANDGILPGRFLLDGFKALQPDEELSRSLQLLTHLDDSAYVERSLITGDLEVEGRRVDLKDIDCPLFLMAGRTDHITPADQVWALAEHVSTAPEHLGRQSATSGHLGLFMSHEALATHWPVIFAEMGALSTPAPEDDPELLTDQPSQT